MTVQEIIAEGLKIKGIKDEAAVQRMVEESLILMSFPAANANASALPEP